MKHPLFLLAAVILSVSMITPIPVTAHIPADIGVYRVFFADDPDPLASDKPIVEGLDIRRIPATEQAIVELAQAFDFYYHTTDPKFTVNSTQVSLSGYQRQQLAEIHTSRETSRWLPSTGGPISGTYIKDASVAIVEVENGVTLHAPGTTADGQHLIPNNGSVYTHADFRVDDTALPDNYCTPIEWVYKTETYTVDVPRYDENGTQTIVRETRIRRVRIDGDQWCTSYRLQTPSINRSLRVGEKTIGQWDNTPAGGLVLPYANLETTGETQVVVTAEIKIIEQSTERHRNWDPGTGWRVESVEVSKTPFSIHVTDAKPIHVTTNRGLTVHQRVIEVSDTRAVVVLEFDGPASIADRRLWSRAVFNDQQELANVWGVYSIQGPHHGYISSNRNPSPQAHEFPISPQLKVTARTTTPEPRFYSTGDLGYVFTPEVIAYYRQQVGTNPFDPGPRVNLSTSPTFRYDAIIVKNAPGAVTEVLDIHGDPIPLTTTPTAYRESVVSINRVDESRVAIQLVSRDDGRGLGGRYVYLTGTDEVSVRTDEQGVAYARPVRGYVTAEFRGDDWHQDHSTYYGPARVTSRVHPMTEPLLGVVGNMVSQWRVLGFWIVLAVFGWLWFESR